MFTPEQFGAFVSWLVVERGGLSVLVHPNTEMRLGEGRGETWEGGAEGDHTVRAMWWVFPVSVFVSVFPDTVSPSFLFRFGDKQDGDSGANDAGNIGWDNHIRFRRGC